MRTKTRTSPPATTPRGTAPPATTRPALGPTYRVRCRRRGLVYELGADHVLSTHRTSEGTVTYLRCPCGDPVVHRAGHEPAEGVDVRGRS